MTTTIADVFDLPTREQITASLFVIKLHEGDEGISRDYVLTPSVAENLPQTLAMLRHGLSSRTDLGWMVHGSFGSGKSHFMSYLGLLLEGAASAWSKDDPTIAALAHEHRAWVTDAKLLVVRLHMLTHDVGPGMGFDRAVFEATNAALRQRGHKPFEFLHTEGVLKEARKEAELYGDVFWKRLSEAGIVSSRAEFEDMANGTPEDREALARAYVQFKGLDPSQSRLDPAYAGGLARLSEHIQSLGYGGLVLLVDELLLWLREKSGPEFERAINQLNLLVDHADGQRAVPLFAFVAQQRNIAEFFPDLAEEKQIHEHLAHHAQRFKRFDLEDVELRWVCRGRVLRVRKGREAEVDAVRADLASRHAAILPTLLQGAGHDYIRDVYPFHPALIETLIDVSSLMQRDRTALRLLFELLVVHQPQLPLGELIPVGAAFEAVFPRGGVEALKKADELRSIHKTYYERFRPAIEALKQQATPGDEDGFDEARAQVLDTVIKTVLLAHVSNKLRGTTAMSVERLVRLNDAEISGETERTKMNRVYQDLLALAGKVPGMIQISGEGRGATVSVVLQGVHFGELLDRARSQISGHDTHLLHALHEVLLPQLGLKKSDLGGTLPLTWRKTTRKGSVDVQNIREAKNADFKVRPGEQFRILIDYPWDDAGYSTADDEQRAKDVLRRDGRSFTACWLPRHFTPHEMQVVRDLAAIAELLGPSKDAIFGDLAHHERKLVEEQAISQKQTLTQTLQLKLTEAYSGQGRIVALVDGISDVVPTNALDAAVKALGAGLMDRQHADHPMFHGEPDAKSLRMLLGWIERAADSSDHYATFTDEELKVLRSLGEPLKLLDPPGSSRARLRLDQPYLKAVRDLASTESVMWEVIDRRLEEAYGLQPVVRNFFLALLLRLDGFRAQHAVTGETIDVDIDAKARANVKLVRAPLIDLARWGRARDLGKSLLGANPQGNARTLAEQDRFTTELTKLATPRKQELSDVHEELLRLGVPREAGRPTEVREAIARLAPLTAAVKDSCQTLQAWLALWPDDQADAVRTVVQRAGVMKTALRGATSWNNLKAAEQGAHKVQVRAMLEPLETLLSARETQTALTDADVKRWNEEATGLVASLLRAPVVEPPPPPPPPPPPVAPPPPPGAKSFTHRVLRAEPAAVDRLIAELRGAIAEANAGEVEVTVTVTPKS